MLRPCVWVPLKLPVLGKVRSAGIGGVTRCHPICHNGDLAVSQSLRPCLTVRPAFHCPSPFRTRTGKRSAHLSACMTTVEDDQSPLTALEVDAEALAPTATETATFGMGCFWGPDARFGAMPGVVRTRVGYAGGTTPDPTYHDLGDHTEVVQIE